MKSTLPFIVRPDIPDNRDIRYRTSKKNIRPKVDLRPWCSPVEDQLELGSCVGQAIVGAYELMINKLYPEKFVDLSRLFVYYNARLIEGQEYVLQDIGAYVREGLKSVNQWGVCAESIWPYIIENFDDAPSIESYEDAEARLIEKYTRLITVEEIVDAINNDYPVVVSMWVYDSFYINEISVNLPGDYEELLGGHAVTLVGYDLESNTFMARNSFGRNWGIEGYFMIPFEYAGKEFMDAWTFEINLK